MTEAAEQKNDIRENLTLLSSAYSVLDIARLKDIVSGLQRQMERDCQELTKANEELSRLRDSYQRFLDLSAHVQAKEARAKIGIAMLANISFREYDGEPETRRTRRHAELSENAGIVLGKDAFDLSRFALWRVIREIVRQTGAIRVFELEEHLKEFGIKARRPAVESAIATHPNEFAVRKHGREKYVSLKGA